MLLALATNPKDYEAAMDLASFFPEMPCEYIKHSALVLGSSTLDQSDVLQLASKVKESGFRSVTAIQQRTEITPSWPQAANSMWKDCALWAKDNWRSHWLWIEPDCAPIQPGWLDKLDAEYVAARKAFCGTLYPLPYNHLNGVAIYTANIHRFNPLIFNSEFASLPFDCVRPDLTLRDAKITNLIWRGLQDPATNTAHTFNTVDDLSIIPSECVLAHACKDGSLIARLREQKNPKLISEKQEKKIGLGGRLYQAAQSVARLVSGPAPYYHSGNLGDVIYALPAIKAAGGGDIIIGPQQRNTAVCAVPIDRKQFEMLEPLLKAQPYLKNISYSEKYPSGCRDLNHFRTLWSTPPARRKYSITTLCQCHFLELGILEKFDAQESEPWLTCSKPMEMGKIVVHRSPRYNAPASGPESFPWQRAVDKYHDDLLFVGLESEHDAFCRNFGKKISFLRVKDFMELANVIAGGREFWGNQSFPLSVALGLGKRVTVEALPRSPDCRFFRDNYTDQLLETITI